MTTNTSTNTTNTVTKTTSLPQKTELRVQTNITYGDKMIEITDSIENIELLMILIFVQICAVLSIKIFKMCVKAYQKHNSIIINRHNRVSPNI